MASGRIRLPPKLPQGNITSGASGFTGEGRPGDANIGPDFYSDYTTDYEIDGDDPIFNDYGSRICDNDEIVPDDNDLTSFRVDQSHWTLNNLPEILYVLKPRAEDAISPLTPDLIDHPFFTNLIIRRFDVLPDQISSKVEGWRVITWLRMDGRIKLRDIVDRMQPQTFDAPGEYIPSDWYIKVLSRVSWRCKQTYKDFNIVRWWNQDTTHLNKVIKLLEETGIDRALNTTRGITPGLIDPKHGELAGRIPIPNNHYERYFYETTQLPPLPPSTGKQLSNFPPYPPPPGEESDADETRGRSNEHRFNQSISAETTRQGESDTDQLLKDFQAPMNTNMFLEKKKGN